MKTDCISTTKSSGAGHIHKKPSKLSMHSMMLIQDLCAHFSFDLSPNMSSYDFYTIEAKDKRLGELLNFESYGYLRYNFEKVLSQCVSDLFFAKKCYIEFAITNDDKKNIVGLSLIPFDAIRLITICNNTVFLSKKHNGEFFLFKLPTNQYIELNTKGIGVKKNYFRKLVKKLERIDMDHSTEFILDEEMAKKFDFSCWKTRKDFLLLKYPYEIGWFGRNSSNSLLSESYLLYRIIRFKLFRKKTLEYLLQRINEGLQKISDDIRAEGRIVVQQTLIDYENEWNRYIRGEICSSELCNIIYGKR